MTKGNSWHDNIPQHLLAKAYRAGAELAWRRFDVAEVITLLQAAGRSVIGVDIWLATKGGPTIPAPYVYDWSAGQPSDDPLYQGSAEDFVRRFVWHPDDRSHVGDEPWFNIVVSDKQDAAVKTRA